jgi:hypothetical protein
LCHVCLASISHFLVFDPHQKAVGFNLWLLTNRIALFHWNMGTLNPHLKWLFLECHN